VKAVKKFQESRGLGVSGTVGPGTWKKLCLVDAPDAIEPRLKAGCAAKVTGLTVAANSKNAITVQWKAYKSAKNYSLIYSASPSFEKSVTISSEGTSREVTSLKEGTTYFFVIIARNNDGMIGDSKVVSAHTHVSVVKGCYWNPNEAPSGEIYHIPADKNGEPQIPYAYENSPQGVKDAAEGNAKGSEGKKFSRIDIDLRVTKDGVIVATHTADVFAKGYEAGFVDTNLKNPVKQGGVGDLNWNVIKRLEHKHEYKGKVYTYNIHKVEDIIAQAARSGIALQFELKESSQWQSKNLLAKLLKAVNDKKAKAYITTKEMRADREKNLAQAKSMGFWTRYYGQEYPTWSGPKPDANACK
jgi:hypothetical protein